MWVENLKRNSLSREEAGRYLPLDAQHGGAEREAEGLSADRGQ